MGTRVTQTTRRSVSDGMWRSLIAITDGLVSGTPEIATLLGPDPENDRRLLAISTRIFGDDGIITGSIQAAHPDGSDEVSLDSYISIATGLATANQAGWQHLTRDSASVNIFWSRPPVTGLILPKELAITLSITPTGAAPTDRAIVTLITWTESSKQPAPTGAR